MARMSLPLFWLAAANMSSRLDAVRTIPASARAGDTRSARARPGSCRMIRPLAEAQGAVRTAGASSAKLSRYGRMGGDAWTESALPLCRCARLLRNAQRHTAGRSAGGAGAPAERSSGRGQGRELGTHRARSRPEHGHQRRSARAPAPLCSRHEHAQLRPPRNSARTSMLQSPASVQQVHRADPRMKSLILVGSYCRSVMN